jgi:hypothetical protein
VLLAHQDLGAGADHVEVAEVVVDMYGDGLSERSARYSDRGDSV